MKQMNRQGTRHERAKPAMNRDGVRNKESQMGSHRHPTLRGVHGRNVLSETAFISKWGHKRANWAMNPKVF